MASSPVKPQQGSVRSILYTKGGEEFTFLILSLLLAYNIWMVVGL